MAAIAATIERALNHLMMAGIAYDKIPNSEWEMRLIEQEADRTITKYMDNLYKVKNEDKALYDFIEFDSKVEQRFAADLDANERVRLFMKLPDWFRIDTPIGPYNPDWAFVAGDAGAEERLYFVRETKSSLLEEDRRYKENQKIECGLRHFKTLGVDFKDVADLSQVSLG